MCLLITKPKDVEFKEEHLVDFYQRNRDGIGVMFAEDGKLFSYKLLPNNARDTLDFYEKYAAGRECAIHYRMRTHGEIDHENCHPYPVFGFDGSETDMPMLLMHNGVLHTGNAADKSKSDTWHYIRGYLHKLLAKDPALAFTPEFQDVIGKHIGNNRFVLMNHEGETAVVNKSQGTEFLGAWLSNEYAWSASKYLPRKTYSSGYTHNGVYYGNYKGNGSYSTGRPTGGWQTKSEDDGMTWLERQGYTGKQTPSTTTAAGGGKTKKARKNAKQQQLALPMPTRTTTPAGGSKTIPTGRQAALNEQNGVSVDCKWLDDILELRSILDAFYPKNMTSNKQIECLIEECGVTHAYYALELLGDEHLSEQQWDKLTSDRGVMRRYADMDPADWFMQTGAAALETM